MQLQHPNLSDAVEAEIRTQIVDGRLFPGQRLNEVRLARDLGVSRTPLREALNRLTAEGALEARPRLGYFVKPLSLDEFNQIYDLRPILDPAALRMAGVPSRRRLAQLERLNATLLKVRDGEAVIAADDAWHFALLAHCENTVLLDQIRIVGLRTRRYELALLRERGAASVATDHHAHILAALHGNDLEAACAHLKENLEWGKPAIAAWLKARSQMQQGDARTK
jgi:DNA-binding GntR family transcriptional regulator